MRVKSLTILVAAALAGLALVGPAGSAPAGKPRLALASTQPVTVRAGRHGAFTTAFDGVRAGRCDGLRVTATGAQGSRATLRRPPLPACMPA